MAARIDDGLDIPEPSKRLSREKMVSVPLQTAMKAALFLAMKEAGITRIELARELHTHEKEVRRILDPHHGTKLPTMERALSALGRRAELRVI